jgi:hypothetical protein
MEFERTLSPFYLSRQPKTHKLSEAVVRASKVKFFFIEVILWCMMQMHLTQQEVLCLKLSLSSYRGLI